MSNDLVELSNDINIITAEINAYQKVAGEAVFEIGRRLKHVKENGLVHGEWSNWCASVGMNQDLARRYVRVSEEFSEGKHVTSRTLSLNALYEIAQIQPEQREVPHTIPSTGATKTVDEMTVRELREVKKALRQANEDKQILGQLLTEERNKPLVQLLRMVLGFELNLTGKICAVPFVLITKRPGNRRSRETRSLLSYNSKKGGDYYK